jgi:hypothetical protein
MNKPESPCRLAVFLARKAPTAVILRRGPSDWSQLALWDREVDKFELGQWFHGRIYERRCDLSPDGRYFVYFAAKYGSGLHKDPDGIGETWTAISRPPYFTALSLWPNIGAWYGGGIFAGDERVLLDATCTLTPRGKGPPPNFKIGALPAETAPWQERLLRDCWQLDSRGFDPRSHWRVGAREIWEKPHKSKAVTLFREVEDVDFKRYGGFYWDTYWLEVEDDLIPLPEVTWADWDSLDRLVFVRNGMLLAGWLEGVHLEERPLFDFNPLRPEEVAPPDWARKW